MNRDSSRLTMKNTLQGLLNILWPLVLDIWTFSDRWSVVISPVTFGRNSFRFSMVTLIPASSEISIDAAYNNSQTSSTLLRSFIIANLQISNISAAEARSMNDPWSSVTTGPTTDKIVCKSRRGTTDVILNVRQLWIRGYQPNQPTIELMCVD